MIELLTDPAAWAGLLTLVVLEIVLGIDNLIFLSIVSDRLPRHQQRAARQIGLALALLGRVTLLFSLTWLIGLTAPVLTVLGFDLSCFLAGPSPGPPGLHPSHPSCLGDLVLAGRDGSRWLSQ